MIEYGEILPKSGKEKKWFNSLSINLKKRLKRLEK
jgi:adenylyl- and sulfurtransferase ThiI